MYRNYPRKNDESSFYYANFTLPGHSTFTNTALAKRIDKVTLVNHCPSTAEFIVQLQEFLPDLKEKFTLEKEASLSTKVLSEGDKHGRIQVVCKNEAGKKVSGFLGVDNDGFFSYNWSGVNYSFVDSTIIFCLATTYTKEKGCH